VAQLTLPASAVGKQRELLERLHELHARAGWPSTREMAKKQSFSHSTVHDLFTSTNSPKLPILVAVVARLSNMAPRVDDEATLDEFDKLWKETVAELREKAGETSQARQKAAAVVADLQEQLPTGFVLEDRLVNEKVSMAEAIRHLWHIESPFDSRLVYLLANDVPIEMAAASLGITTNQAWSMLATIGDRETFRDAAQVVGHRVRTMADPTVTRPVFRSRRLSQLSAS
jgi:hypothetical protein